MGNIHNILDRLKEGQRTRLVAFGSSNTDRRIHGLHWFDWLDLALKQTYGRVHHSINAGLGGDTTPGLLARFDQDVALYQPHAVFITIGGNDSNPDKAIAAPEYRANLRRLTGMVRDLDAVPILQTYYAADIPNLGQRHGSQFLHYMDIVRETAVETGTVLVDHHRRWEPLRLTRPDLYRALMLDALHVNPLGNMLMGLDLIRAFHAALAPEQLAFCAQGLQYQQLLDRLSSGEKDHLC
ncbi:MAG: GDSL-type esterase/lipase family protein [Anaerolineae bacterium]|nr:GDSL-type esterase/lipase family protein [Anaerolineae bacterium]